VKGKKPQLERIADQVHRIWVEWTKQVSRRVKPVWRERWRRLWIEYDRLPESEKDKDRKFARKIQRVVKSSSFSTAYKLGRQLAQSRNIRSPNIKPPTQAPSYFRRNRTGFQSLSRIRGLRRRIHRAMNLSQHG